MVEEESQLSLEPHLPFLWNSDVRDLKISIFLACVLGLRVRMPWASTAGRGALPRRVLRRLQLEWSRCQLHT